MDAFAKTRTAADAFLARIGEKPLVMGILNVTPDSFSDGGRFCALESALAHAEKLAAEGADVIDIGAESTRPGFSPVDAEAEWARLAPVLPLLLEQVAPPLSIDTTKASVARRAAELGVAVINDVSGLRADPQMAEVAAESGAALVVMHFCDAMDPARDICTHMRDFFAETLEMARKAGVAREKIILDPGIGFGKTLEQNLQAIAATRDLRREFGLPVLVGLSRKSFIGSLTGAPAGDRLAGTLAANLDAFFRGAAVFRVHDVAEHVQALKIGVELARY